jgi:hypothetical protein
LQQYPIIRSHGIMSFMLIFSASIKFGNYLKNRLREKGQLIPENDIWVGATCIQYNLTLVSKDEHFEFIEGLSIEEWWLIEFLTDRNLLLGHFGCYSPFCSFWGVFYHRFYSMSTKNGDSLAKKAKNQSQKHLDWRQKQEKFTTVNEIKGSLTLLELCSFTA